MTVDEYKDALLTTILFKLKRTNEIIREREEKGIETGLQTLRIRKNLYQEVIKEIEALG